MSVVANVAINIDGKQALQLLNAIESEVNKLNGSFEEIKKKGGGIFDNIKSAAGSVVGQLAAAAGAAFTLQQAFTTLAAQSKAEGALRTLGVNAGVAKEEFAKLSQELQGQASVVELTTAAYDVASAGFVNTADQVKILEAATKGAVGGMSDINTVGNAVTSVLNAYGMSADQASILVDGFIQTQNDGKIVLGEYAALIGRLAPTAAAAGVGIKELNAAVATITAQGVAPESAVTGLTQAIVAILKPTAEAQELSKALGIDFSETGLRAKGLGGFLQSVAQATGGSTSELTKLFGSVDALKAVLPLLSGDMQKFVENLRRQEEAAGVADKAFKEMANTLEGALKEVDTAFKNLIVSFSPVLPAIIAPLKVLANTITLITGNLKELAVAATFIGAYVFTLNAAAIATNAVAFATKAFSAAQKVAGVASAFLQSVLLGPAGMTNVALALGVATAAAVTLGVAMDEAGGKADAAKTKQLDVGTQIKTEQEKAAEAAKATAAAQDIINQKLETQLAPLKAISAEYTKQQFDLQNQIKSLDRGATVTAARYEAEKALSDLSLQQLNRQYELATTAEKRLELARLIFNEQINAAKIEYNQALEAITLGERKIELETKLAELKSLQLKANANELIMNEKDLAKKAEIRADLEKALASQNEVIKATKETGIAEQEVNKYKKITAGAQYESKILTAQIAYEQKLVSKEIGLSKDEAQSFSKHILDTAKNASNTATNTEHIARAANSASVEFQNLAINASNAANSIQSAANAQINLNNSKNNSGGGGSGSSSNNVTGAANGAYFKGGFSAFAKGGVVTKPTLGLIGEGGEPEYIIPESKMARASANYMAGARGGAVIPAFANGGVVGPSGGNSGRSSASTMIKPQVSIQTGPVMQINGTNYVTTADLGRAVQSSIKQTLNILRNDINVRGQMGMA